MGEHFDKVKIGEFFEVDGEVFKKTSELMFESIAKIEQMIDPLWDKKIGRTAAEKEAAAAKATVDTSAKIVGGTPTDELTGQK
jgi:hypothetical protein